MGRFSPTFYNKVWYLKKKGKSYSHDFATPLNEKNLQKVYFPKGWAACQAEESTVGVEVGVSCHPEVGSACSPAR